MEPLRATEKAQLEFRVNLTGFLTDFSFQNTWVWVFPNHPCIFNHWVAWTMRKKSTKRLPRGYFPNEDIVLIKTSKVRTNVKKQKEKNKVKKNKKENKCH